MSNLIDGARTEAQTSRSEVVILVRSRGSSGNRSSLRLRDHRVEQVDQHVSRFLREPLFIEARPPHEPPPSCSASRFLRERSSLRRRARGASAHQQCSRGSSGNRCSLRPGSQVRAELRCRTRRDAMPPPELPADAPVLDVAHPFEIHGRPSYPGTKRMTPGLDRANRGLRQRLDVDEPLIRQQRFQYRVAAIAARHGELVRLDPLDEPQRLEIGDDCGCARRRDRARDRRRERCR